MNDINRTDTSFMVSAGFWKERIEDIMFKALPYQWKALNNQIPGAPASHAVENFRIAAGESEGVAKGTIFQDSDVAKWIEAASNSLRIKPNPELEEKIDYLVHLIEKSQLPDGYVNTYFIAAVGLEKRWSDLVMGHEMYCAGHMIEAAVAYYRASGKRTFMDVMCRFADYIGTVFGPGPDQNHSFDGHPEIELALHKLADATGEQKYADLANHFVDVRGKQPDFHIGTAAKEGMIPKSRWFYSDYYLAHKPVREMTEPEGHAVRAMYLYCAMSDQYLKTGDTALWESLKKIWDSLLSKYLYITGGIGSQAHGERFTIAYDLPNDTCYTETCASIGLGMWAWRMLQIDPDREYADMMERVLYNGVLSGISLDGTRYLYVNPLEINPDVARYRHDHEHVTPERVPWFDCACCPTNVARFILSLPDYISTHSGESVWIHHYAEGSTDTHIGSTAVCLGMTTEYPWSPEVKITIDPEKAVKGTIRLRIPGWCSKFDVSVNNEELAANTLRIEKGYLVLERIWQKDDCVALNLAMPVRFLRANNKVRENSGKLAIQRGPVVYCAEAFDNGPDLHELVIDPKAGGTLVSVDTPVTGTLGIQVRAYRDAGQNTDNSLYYDYTQDGKAEAGTALFIPYFQWGNRKPGEEMRVWFRYT